MPARLRNGVLLMVAALASIVLLTACGGGSAKPKHANRASAFVALSKCMRTHGVTNFPDPVNGGGIQLPNGFNTQSPAFKAAQGICFKLLPGRPGSHSASAAAVADARNTAECMRQHGVPKFPDPIVTNKPPFELNLNPADYGEVTAGGGIVIALPVSINTQSPAFEKAAKSCQFQQ
jgi:hypothetical protein